MVKLPDHHITKDPTDPDILDKINENIFHYNGLRCTTRGRNG